MQKSGMVYVGLECSDALDAAQKLTGAKNHPDTLRALLRAVVKDPATRRAVRSFITDDSTSTKKGGTPSRTGKTQPASSKRTKVVAHV